MADDLAKKVGDAAKPADQKDKDALRDLEKALEKELGKANADISTDKNPHLFSGVDPENLRSDLNDMLGDIEKELNKDPKDPRPAAEVAKEARRLADDAKDAKNKIADFRQDLPEDVKEKSKLADKIAKDLPAAAKFASSLLFSRP